MGTIQRALDRVGRAAPKVSWLPIVLVVAVPNVWLFSGAFQMFPAAGWVDPGMYLGYFLGLRESIERFGPTYHAMRLPFTAVGAAFFTLFSPETAMRAMVVAWNSLAACSLYVLVGRRSGPAAGALASFWLSLNPLWIAAIARGYVDGPAMAYLLAALALVLNRDEWARRTPALAGCGALAALSVFTHPLAIVLFMFAILADLAVTRPRPSVILRDASHIALGAIAATVALGVLSVLVRGPFLFFLGDTSQMVARTFSGFGANYKYELRDWLPGAYRLAPAASCMALGLLSLRLEPRNKGAVLAATGTAMLAGITLVFRAMSGLLGAAPLQSSFYSSYMIAGEALIAGALASAAMRTVARPIQFVVLSAAGLGVLALTVFNRAESLWGALAMVDPSGRVAWLSFFCLFATVICLSYLRLSILAFFTLAATTILAGTINRDTKRIFVTPSGVDFATTFRSTIETTRFVEASVPKGKRFLFWYRREEMSIYEQPRRQFALYDLKFGTTHLVLNHWDSLVAVWQWDRGSLGWTMPVLLPDEIAKLQANMVQTSVITLCLELARCEEAAIALRGYGYMAEERARTRIDGGYVPFYTVIYHFRSAG